MTKHEAEQHLEVFNLLGGRLCPCTHGHFECSSVEDGPCFDEVMALVESRP
jgi:hypothetical protein